ncbi:serine/threonine-protein kinase, partial [Streptomyces abyssalis]
MRPVGSKYLLEEPLGRGATGTVWRARQNQTAGAEAAVPGQPGETVAIKVLKEELANDPDVVMRFLRERSVLLRLQHHNIVRTRDLVVEGDLLALVMDLVEGPDLHRYLRENGPFSPVAAALVTAQVADALAASHADGIVHRDLKPANVLLADGPEGMRPMLTDFGIARLADSPGLTRTQEFVGTPAYVAPESAEGRPQTSAVDIYGAGILLYELATGQPPFAGSTALEVLQRHLREDPVRPPSMPDPLWTVVERCLRKQPEERPSAVNLAIALRTVAGGISAQATPDQAAAAMGVAGLLAPDPAPAPVPETGTGGGAAAAAAGGAVA